MSLPPSIPVPQASLAPSRSKLPLHVRPSQPNSRALAHLQDGEGPPRPQYPGASKRGPSVAIGAASHASGPVSLAGGNRVAAAAAAPSQPRRPITAAARTVTTAPPASLNTRAMSRAKGGATSSASAIAAVDTSDVAVAVAATATADDDPDDAASANTDADTDANTKGGAAGASRLNETSRPPLQLPPTPMPTPRQLLLLDSLAQVGAQLPSLSLGHPPPAPPLSPPPPLPQP